MLKLAEEQLLSIATLSELLCQQEAQRHSGTTSTWKASGIRGANMGAVQSSRVQNGYLINGFSITINIKTFRVVSIQMPTFRHPKDTIRIFHNNNTKLSSMFKIFCFTYIGKVFKLISSKWCSLIRFWRNLTKEGQCWLLIVLNRIKKFLLVLTVLGRFFPSWIRIWIRTQKISLKVWSGSGQTGSEALVVC